MRILVDINHPAHVHLFKHFIWEMQNRGHEVIVTASRKDIAFYLLKKYNIEFINLGSYGNSLTQKAMNIPIMAYKIFKVVKKYDIDILFGMASSRIAHAAFLLGKKSLVLTDTEHAKEQIALFKPFATNILTPDCFRNDLGKKQVRYPGYHELAYLHPNRFTPNPEVLKEVGLTENDNFFIVRFVSWEASHDIGQKGLSLEEKEKLIELLKPHGKVIISSEKDLPEKFEPYRMSICPTKMHDLLYYATMYVGEGGTMASEAACLGTYSIYINSLPEMGYIKEEIEKYKLIFKSTEWEKIKKMIEYHLSNPNCKKEVIEKTKKIINEKVDVTKYLLDYVENY
jgi:predicted glycosyltransferase